MHRSPWVQSAVWSASVVAAWPPVVRCWKWRAATGATLAISNAQATEIGYYGVNVTTVYGAITSSNASLALWPLVAWGNNGNGQTNIPVELTNVVGIAAGNYYSLALKADGTVVGWGDNYYGQTDIPAGLSKIVSIAAGGVQRVQQVRKLAQDVEQAFTGIG